MLPPIVVQNSTYGGPLAQPPLRLAVFDLDYTIWKPEMYSTAIFKPLIVIVSKHILQQPKEIFLHGFLHCNNGTAIFKPNRKQHNLSALSITGNMCSKIGLWHLASQKVSLLLHPFWLCNSRRLP
jgi:hypothetical protein